MKRRQKARRWVLQILYAWEVCGRERGLPEEAGGFFERRQIASETRVFAEELIGVLAAHIAEIDAVLAESAEHWEPDRMSIIDRNVLRLALTELLYFDDIPFKVTIDEAVRLAARYGGQDSPRFVNGVLDAAAHRLDLIPS
ncbi:MAG TPA: transcription antitermination factor NusB [Gemmatimonadota bacterium]|nr:transcription antitermination factor NusB [Gemmatimonadota bacterium]